MVSLEKKLGGQGFNIVSVTKEAAGPVEAMIKDKGMNYFTALISGEAVQTYGIRGWPTMMMIGPDGNFISTRTRVPSEDQIKAWIETLVPSKLDVEVTRKTKNAGKAYDKSDYAKALEEANKVLSGEEVEAGDKKVADRVVELVGLQAKKAGDDIKSMIESKDFVKLTDYVKSSKKQYKGTEAESVFDEAEKTLKTKEVKAEISAEKKMLKIVADYKKAGRHAKKQAAALKKMQKFAEKNSEYAAGDKAQAYADKWEIAANSSASK